MRILLKGTRCRLGQVTSIVPALTEEPQPRAPPKSEQVMPLPAQLHIASSGRAMSPRGNPHSSIHRRPR